MKKKERHLSIINHKNTLLQTIENEKNELINAQECNQTIVNENKIVKEEITKHKEALKEGERIIEKLYDRCTYGIQNKRTNKSRNYR